MVGVTRRSFLASCLLPAREGFSQNSKSVTPAPHLISEFKGLGLFDISTDGKMFAFHQRGDSLPCETFSGCSDREEKILIRDSAGRRVRDARLSFKSDNFSLWAIAFFPNSHDLLLRGRRLDVPGEPIFHRWDADTGEWRRLADPAGRFEFVAIIDEARFLGTAPVGNKSVAVTWNPAGAEVRPVESAGVLELSDLPLARAWLRAADGPKIAARGLPDLGGRRVLNAACSAAGVLAVISAEAQDRIFAGLYDWKSRQLIRQTQILADERIVEKKAWLANAKYKDGELQHIAYQIAISPDGEALALSYERETAANPILPGLRQYEPKFALYSMETLAHLGTVAHLKVNRVG